MRFSNGWLVGKIVYAPAQRECVEVAGCVGLFIVLSVDHEARKADVVRLEGQAYLLSDVPFSLLEPSRRDSPPDTH
jgi:hypothetical protein